MDLFFTEYKKRKYKMEVKFNSPYVALVSADLSNNEYTEESNGRILTRDILKTFMSKYKGYVFLIFLDPSGTEKLVRTYYNNNIEHQPLLKEAIEHAEERTQENVFEYLCKHIVTCFPHLILPQHRRTFEMKTLTYPQETRHDLPQTEAEARKCLDNMQYPM